MTRGICGTVAAIAVMLVAAPPAIAAVTIGSDLDASPDAAGFNCDGLDVDCTLAQDALPASSTASGGLVSPIDGVVVRWRIEVGSDVTPVRLRITRPGSSQTRAGAGTGPSQTPAPNATSTFSVQLPIQAGDGIGVDCCNGPALGAVVFSPMGGPLLHTWYPRLEDGQTTPADFANFPYELLINADIEPDADCDGLGDETQDPSVTPPCPQPEPEPEPQPEPQPEPGDSNAPHTTITKTPKDKTKRRTATFEFTGTDTRAVASFQCSLDDAPFASCASPHSVKVKKGKHTFQVRAIDDAGNIGTAASDSWKVKKKKRGK